ncbi:MAG: LPXTG cell wall anchor domain-containing protein [Oscillospiraceae bacterium]|nr:LPXTG cell wall anchor domain-containing protein [Oscillospiraceae bacterium]
MSRKIMKVFSSLLALALCLAAVPAAFAADDPVCVLDVTVALEGTLPEPAETLSVVMQADDASYPMPAGAVDGTYTMSVSGAGTYSFPTITYSRVGVYTYTIWQEPGTDATCTYDDTVYTLTVYVTNREDGTGLDSTAILYPDASGDKAGSATFTNVYPTITPTPDPTDPPATATPTPTGDAPKTGDDSNIALWAGIVALCACGLGAVVVLRKKESAR